MYNTWGLIMLQFYTGCGNQCQILGGETIFPPPNIGGGAGPTPSSYTPVVHGHFIYSYKSACFTIFFSSLFSMKKILMSLKGSLLWKEYSYWSVIVRGNLLWLKAEMYWEFLGLFDAVCLKMILTEENTLELNVIFLPLLVLLLILRKQKSNEHSWNNITDIKGLPLL